MGITHGEQLAHDMRQGIKELKRVCQGVQEDGASRAPEGRWSPKEILSHLLGPEGVGLLPMLQAFLDQESPTIDIEAENPFFTEKRTRMTFAQLLAEVEEEYERMARFTAGLSADQLERSAHIPLLKGSPFSEYPTLATWIDLLTGPERSHLHFHTGHMREVLLELGVAAK